ncbi:M50 family metallopeptidase [Actinomycetospora termitidis]|uniref:M50 family metallopeptidase n=1 Tax=Actinomycetospora termitidis TaxID=3053470 RepID=A0ABT7MBM5_9PSEU|nr:M50 family metallopeptidase [Actinomycetospora sp. Odt1-22]MDL5158076.1 M50 family metallopeptidase [Actinomycetospora sp. Odt1-22]
MVDELIDVSIVGEPVVYGAGFVALLLVVFTGSWAGSIPTLTHEGAHALMNVLTFRGLRGVHLSDGGGGYTESKTGEWGVGLYLVVPAGYLGPPLLGLGGAAVLADGNAWGVLAGVVVILAITFVIAGSALANVVTLVALAGVVLALWQGSNELQVALAIVVVWWLLLGGVRASVIMSRQAPSDAARMQSLTLVPALAWQAFWVIVALACLYAGGRLLFLGEAWPDGVWPFNEQA